MIYRLIELYGKFQAFPKKKATNRGNSIFIEGLTFELAIKEYRGDFQEVKEETNIASAGNSICTKSTMGLGTGSGSM